MSPRLASSLAATAALCVFRLAFAQTGSGGTFEQGLPAGAPPPPPPPAAAPGGGSGAAFPDTAAPAAPGSSAAPPSEGVGSAAPVVVASPSGGLAPSSAAPAADAPDAAAAKRRRDAERAVLVSRLEAGGMALAGLDATDAALRQGGFYGSGTYRFASDVVLQGRYSFASGHVIERLPGNQGGRFGVPNDVDVLESRHAFDLTIGYAFHGTGPLRAFAIPFLGPRVPLLLNSVAARWAFEGEFGARVGVWSTDVFEASALLAYAPALAKEKDLPDVQGGILSELRFGAGVNVRAAGPLGLSLGYEGNVVTLAHQRVSSHGLLAGLSYSLE